ncbi:sigma-54-dependent transcriptional regulator [Sulfuriferula sp. GW1]|uniref:sigma-54-dependent transcriptional regulator n=1 Tax=Sulfuriferula sp. GW1 TaxID=3345111 RepID=UPI0039AF1483
MSTSPYLGQVDASGMPTASSEFGSWQQYAILVIDDEGGMRNFLGRALSSRCGAVKTAASAEDGARLVEEQHFDLIILDVSLPGKSGIEWLHELRHTGFYGDVILITAFADMETAIGALRAGATDFILKPFRIDQLLNAIGRCFDRAHLARENFVLRRAMADLSEVTELVGESSAMAEMRAMINRLAPLPTTVLISGESGTGKEVVARALHNHSPRASQPFVPVNCGAIAAELMESELFGHVKGAFTGSSGERKGLFFYAQGGTLFLDEVGELPLAMQTKLLRALEEKKIRPVGSEREIPVDVRIIAATNRKLSSAVHSGHFRADLFYRLDVMSILIPPLRERRDDVLPLARHFMGQLSAQLGVPPITICDDILQAMRVYAWPGNARELRNLIERSLILGKFPIGCVSPVSAPALPGQAPVTLEEVEKQHILRVLDSVSGNKSEAARLLDISRKTLERKCTVWQI